jgi:hypothetical protein
MVGLYRENQSGKNNAMSMIVTTVSPEGIVMAADSSLLTFRMIDMVNFMKCNIQEAVTNTVSGTCAYEKTNIVGSRFLTRSACKLHVMKNNNMAIGDGNQRNIRKESISPYINYFCNNYSFNDPKSCGEGLLNFIRELDQNINAVYHVCGYNMEGKIPHPEFWLVDVKNNLILDGVGGARYGISFCGANEYFSPYALPISKNIMSFSLQDAIDDSMFAIDMSIKLERFIDREEFISPPVDLLVIEPAGVKWIKQKTLKAEG